MIVAAFCDVRLPSNYQLPGNINGTGVLCRWGSSRSFNARWGKYQGLG